MISEIRGDSIRSLERSLSFITENICQRGKFNPKHVRAEVDFDGRDERFIVRCEETDITPVTRAGLSIGAVSTAERK